MAHLYDNDGLTWWEEVGADNPNRYNTDPTLQDTDGDGLWDREALYIPDFDPFTWDDPNGDPDSDDFTNAQEINQMFTDPLGYEKWALVVCGGEIGGNQQEDFNNVADYAFFVLDEKGYDGDHIYYLNPDDNRDANNDGNNDVNKIATKTNVRDTIFSWLKGSSDVDDRCFIYFVNHGQVDTGHFVIGSKMITDTEIGDWLNGIDCSHLVFVIEACYSGNFIDDVKGVNRIAISSSDSTHPAGPNPGTDWPAFSYPFLNDLRIPVAVEQAFNYADGCVQISYPNQNPQMDDQIPGEHFL